jgi:predicted kinase
VNTQRLLITRGLPASGKSTLARAWVAEEPATRTRVNRDDLRALLFNGAGVLEPEQENAVTRVQRTMVRTMLHQGRSVIVDDTNLRLKFAREWAQLALEAKVVFEVVDVLTDVDECVRRDTARGAAGERAVGEAVIRDIAKRFMHKALPPVTVPEAPAATVLPYTPDPSLPAAWLVDVDGTLAHMVGRGPFEWHRVGEDSPAEVVVAVVSALAEAEGSPRMIVMSGRDAVCRPQTEAWLRRHQVPFHELHMRAEGDQRKDSIVKAELFDEHIRHRFNVIGVIDDRDQVVRMWRDQLGLVCLQVADGNF